MLRLKGILILILLKLCEKCGFTNGWICSTIVTYYAFIFLGKINRNKICSTCTGITDQAETDTEAIDQTAKDTDQQCIISDRLAGNNIRKQTGKHDHTDRTYGKFLSDKLQTNKYRNRVQQYINQRIWNCNPHKCLKNVLDQQSKSCKSSRKKTACTNKCLNIQS